MSSNAVHTVVLDEDETQRNDAQEHAVQIQADKPRVDALQLDDHGLYRMVTQLDELRVAKMLIETGAVPKSFTNPPQVMMAIQALKSLKLNWRTAIRQCGFNQQGTFMVYGDLELAVVRQSGLLENIDEYLFTKNPAWREPVDATELIAKGQPGVDWRQAMAAIFEGKDDDKIKALSEDLSRAMTPAQPYYLRRSMQNNNVDLPVVGAVCCLHRKGESTPHEAIFTVEDAKVAGLWGKTPTWRNFPSRMMQMRARGIAIRNSFSDITQGLAGVEYDHEGIDYDRK